jgi:murein DD-endopeptidase MepM/ murein hydrolase activator NlpD
MTEKGTPDTPSMRAIARAHRKPFHLVRKTLLLVALGLFGTAGALAVVEPPEKPAAYTARSILELPELPSIDQVATSDPFISETVIQRGDTLAALLQRLNVHEPGLQAFLIKEPAARSIYKLYPGRIVRAALDHEGRLVSLRYDHTPGVRENGRFLSRWLEVQPDGQGGFIATENEQLADTQVRIAEGEISSSLFGATDAAGIPDHITLQMVEILASKIDFLQDLRKGDRFRLVYETYAHDGREVGAGRVLALEFQNKDKTYDAVWFAPEGSGGGYYDFNGVSLRGAFLRNALKFTRISSTFGGRRHPVHGGFRQHKGVDYAAPAGTPIHATADGVVKFAGWQNGYGNTIIIEHHNKISTLYAHQQGFAKGIKAGVKVSQGMHIGYVGSTGWSTGPHLHYEFRVNDKPVDPLSVDLPVARTLSPAERKQFDTVVAQYRDHIQLLQGPALASSEEPDPTLVAASQ